KLHQCRGEWPSGYALTPLPPACNTMAWFYAAEWPTFAPPLTNDGNEVFNAYINETIHGPNGEIDWHPDFPDAEYEYAVVD
ncbi:hypothetical protein OSJ57_25245, partial [Sphingomonas sp. HH69]